MSANFFTPVPVDLAAIKNLLPPDAYVDPVLKWNKEANRVEVHWSSNQFKSPYSFPHEFTVDMLLGRELPKFVTGIPVTEAKPIVVTETASEEAQLQSEQLQPDPEPHMPEEVSVSDNEKPVDEPKKQRKNKKA